MKQLYLLRHAKSSWKETELNDYDRPLSTRGKRDAPFIGKLLNEENVQPDLIISSPAKRAITTAEIITKEIGYPIQQIEVDERIYEADVQNLLMVINNISENINSLMLIGHNPGITSLSNYISDKRIDNIPTCGVVFIELNVKHWKDVDFDNGKIQSFDYPKKYISA